MTKPDLETVPTFYKVYVDYVKDMELYEALHYAAKEVQDLVSSIPEEAGLYRYEDGKWSVKEVLNHMMDAERVFAYRALRFARRDTTPLHPFDENTYAPLANAHARTIQQLGVELQRLRASTIDLYSSFTSEILLSEGTASGKKISVLNLGYTIAGHDIHHIKVLKDRYFKR
jgi:uncharacterized damage-inducible protein DinB